MILFRHMPVRKEDGSIAERWHGVWTVWGRRISVRRDILICSAQQPLAWPVL